MSRVIKNAVIIGEGPKLIENPSAVIAKDTAEDENKVEKALADQAALMVIINQKQQKADEMLQNAEMQRSAILADAKQEVDRMFAEAQQQIVELKEQARQEAVQNGYDEGHAHGYKAGKEEVAALIEKANEKAQHTLELAETECQETIQSAEKQIVDIATAIAEKIVRQHVADFPPIILPMVQEALLKVRDQSSITVKVAPDDYEFVLMAKDEFRSILESDSDFSIVSDSKIEAGGCIVESENGNVDARIQTKLDALKKVIQEVGQYGN